MLQARMRLHAALVLLKVSLLLAWVMSASAFAQEVNKLWEAPGGMTLSPEAQQWQAQQKQAWRAAAQRELCADFVRPQLDPERPTYAFEVHPQSLARQVVYVHDYLAQDVWLSGVDAIGCPFVRHAGRMVELDKREILSPYPNFVLPELSRGTDLLVLVQDIKPTQPVVKLMEVSAFTRQSTDVFLGIAAIASILMTVLILTGMFFMRIRLRSLQANTTFTACLWLWMLQTYALGESFFGFWPQAHFFPQVQSMATAALVASAAWSVSHFAGLGARWGRIYVANALVFGALFVLTIAQPGWYDALMLHLLATAVVTAVLVLRVMFVGANRVQFWSGLGLMCLLAGGVLQTLAQTMLGSEQLGMRIDFGLPIGATLLTVCWFMASFYAVQQFNARENEQKLAQARTDQFTGLWNRDHMSEQIAERLRQRDTPALAGPAQDVALFWIDIDNFKPINDSLGLAIGSALVQSVARRIQKTVHQQVGERALVGYMGGNEFMVMTEPGQSPSALGTLAQMLSQWVALPLVLRGHELRITVSLGYVIANDSYREAQDLIRDAHIAHHEARMRGRGEVVLFEPHMQTHTQARFNLERDLALAIEQQALELHYQPIVTLADGVLAGFEALARWQHPQRGWVSPSEFIPLAEATGLIEPLGRQVMAMAVQAVAMWKDAGLWRAGWYVSVNVSGRQLHGQNLFEDLMSLLKRHGLQPQDVRLEITETSLIANMRDASTELPRLNREGVVLCMDDFGTGYSSLSHLNQLPFQVLKIDKSFMDDLTSNNDRQALVRTVLALARDMKLKVVAEGIERAEQHRWLADLACDFGQGYFFSKPLSERDAHRWLAKSRLAPAGLQAVLP